MKKVLKKYFSPHHWLVFLRQQSTHMQHVYALIIAGGVTLLIASAILYIDYGFWHERYISEEVIVANKSNEEPESPKDMMIRFFDEAKNQIEMINTSRKEILNGKEVYRQGEE